MLLFSVRFLLIFWRRTQGRVPPRGTGKGAWIPTANGVGFHSDLRRRTPVLGAPKHVQPEGSPNKTGCTSTNSWLQCLVSSSYKTDQNCRSQLNTTKKSFNDIPNSSSDFVFTVTDLSDTHQTWQFHRSHQNLRTVPRIFLGTCQPDLHTGTFNLYQAVLKTQITATPLNFGPKSGDHWKFGVF